MGNWNSPSTTATTATQHISGSVHGGQQPVAGARIQLYAVNATTDQGASLPMLTSSVSTANDGTFSITGLYSCPTSNPFVYIVSTAGNPGVGSNNSDIVLMAALGTCSTLSTTPFININELTTATAAYYLAQFIGDAGHIGSSTTNLGSIAQKIASATSLIDLSTGNFRSTVLIAQELQISTMANILAACVNSTGGAAGSATPCGNLLSLAGSGVFDTLAAAVNMAQSPTNNAAQLYALITGTPPFQPYFTTLPTDLTVTVGYPYPANLRAVALDSTGQIWIYTGGYTYDTQHDTSTDLQGVITVYDNNFNFVRTITPPSGGLFYPSGMTSDKFGHVYVVNSNNTISAFASDGTVLSPAGGWSLGFASTFTGSGSGNNYVLSTTSVNSLRADAQGNIWGVTPVGSSNCYFEMNSIGTVITPVGTYCTSSGGISTIAPDGSGNAWTAGNTTISKVNALGALAASAPSSSGCFSPSSSTTNVSTSTIEYDHVGNQLWGYSYTGAGAITNGGTALFCNSGSAALPVIPPFGPSILASPGSSYVGGSLLISSGVLDGAGNFWYLTNGLAENGVVGSSFGTFSGTATFSAYVNGISPSGALLTTYNPATQVYGLKPSGVGTNATVIASNAFVSPSAIINAGLLAVDVNGNLWAEDFLSNRVIKITGLATANTANY